MSFNVELLRVLETITPTLTGSLHKGSCGRIGIVGGNEIYSGAPYYAAMTALRVGGDLATIFCSKQAKDSIKSYSPDVMVYPCLDNEQSNVESFVKKNHALVVGPGLGKEYKTEPILIKIVKTAIESDIDLVFDADGLDFYMENIKLLENYEKITLTPNVVEFGRLYNLIFKETPSIPIDMPTVGRLSAKLKCCILCKGECDIISYKGVHEAINLTPGSNRRCGGQGDLLSGATGLLTYWARKSASQIQHPYPFIAAFLASSLVRHCSCLTFSKHGRSMLASDMLKYIPQAFDEIRNIQ